jgi:hypothetical protein
MVGDQEWAAPRVVSFRRVARIAHVDLRGNGHRYSVFIDVRWDAAKGSLSISGVEGPKGDGDAVGSCGQIVMSPWDAYAPVDGIDLSRLREVWERWHLNDMRAGCEHQRAMGWGGEEISLYHYKLNSETLSAQHALSRRAEEQLKEFGEMRLTPDEHRLIKLKWKVTTDGDADRGPDPEAYELESIEKKLAGWVYPREHPRGVLCKPCPVCGYTYGSAWLREDVPDDVLEFLQALPDDSEGMPATWRRE